MILRRKRCVETRDGAMLKSKSMDGMFPQPARARAVSAVDDVIMMVGLVTLTLFSRYGSCRAVRVRRMKMTVLPT